MWRNPVYQTFQTHKLALKNFDKSLTDTLEKEGKLQKRSREGGKTLVKSGAGIANFGRDSLAFWCGAVNLIRGGPVN